MNISCNMALETNYSLYSGKNEMGKIQHIVNLAMTYVMTCMLKENHSTAVTTQLQGQESEGYES